MRVAITGGIAEGKSTVLRELESRGYRTRSADLIAAEVFRDPEVNTRLAALLGVEGPITGGELREAMMRRPELRRHVNGAMHPGIVARLAEEGAEFDEVPLLLEGCRQGDYDAVILVSCSPAEKARRLADRYKGDGGDRFSEIAQWQLSTRARRPFCDFEIVTDGAVEAISVHVDEMLEALRECKAVSPQ